MSENPNWQVARLGDIERRDKPHGCSFARGAGVGLPSETRQRRSNHCSPPPSRDIPKHRPRLEALPHEVAFEPLVAETLVERDDVRRGDEVEAHAEPSLRRHRLEPLHDGTPQSVALGAWIDNDINGEAVDPAVSYKPTHAYDDTRVDRADRGDASLECRCAVLGGWGRPAHASQQCDVFS